MIAKYPNGTMRSLLSQPENIENLKKLIVANPLMHQRALVKLVCTEYSLVAPNGSLQTAGCHIVLRDLCKKGLIFLPKTHGKPAKFTPMTISDREYPLPENLPNSVHEIKNDLKIILIESMDIELKQIWNDLIGKEHPNRDSRIVGYQVKYLIKYKEFYIGAASFSSSAYHLDARDIWMEWTKEQKPQYQNKVVCMSRFLIRNKIKCENLASHLLSKLVKLIKVDFENRYKISPWVLESFVDTENFAGTCYKAANWQCIGKSKGRGRNDTHNKNDKSKKDLYVYVLEDSFRELGGFKAKVEEFLPMSIETGLLSSEWGRHEFGGIDLGDIRLVERVIKIATDKGEAPSASYAKAVNGISKDIDSYYNFFENESDKISGESLLATHKRNTICRMAMFDQTLSIHDSSSLNYSTLKCTKGLGIISKNKGSEGTLGLLTHTRLACTTDGLPLGILGSPCSAPEVHKEKEKNRDDTPIEEKESYRWVLGYLDDIEVAKKLPASAQLVFVADRECDMFEIYNIAKLHREKNPIVVRSKHNRKLLGIELRLHEYMANEPISFTAEVTIPPQRSREETRDKKARPYKSSRKAILKITYKKVTILPPADNKFLKDCDPIEMYAVYAREENPPKDSERIEWTLLTTLVITTNEMAIKCIGFYKTRWKIEEFFRVVKSGCGIENHKLDDAKKLERIIAISMVIAFRIMVLTFLGRKCPELPVECMFTNDEILIMKLDSKKKVETINDAIKIVASYGGHQNRKNDPPPGMQTMWAGLQKLQERVHGMNIYKNSLPTFHETQATTMALANQNQLLRE